MRLDFVALIPFHSGDSGPAVKIFYSDGSASIPSETQSFIDSSILTALRDQRDSLIGVIRGEDSRSLRDI